MMPAVPYSFPRDVVPSVQTQAAPGQAQGVYTTLHPNAIDDIADKMHQWFETRPEVAIVDVGTADKRGFGFIPLEWMECIVDPLFLSLLQTEEFAADFTTYIRTLNINSNEGGYKYGRKKSTCERRY